MTTGNVVVEETKGNDENSADDDFEQAFDSESRLKLEGNRQSYRELEKISNELKVSRDFSTKGKSQQSEALMSKLRQSREHLQPPMQNTDSIRISNSRGLQLNDSYHPSQESELPTMKTFKH